MKKKTTISIYILTYHLFIKIHVKYNIYICTVVFPFKNLFYVIYRFPRIPAVTRVLLYPRYFSCKGKNGYKENIARIYLLSFKERAAIKINFFKLFYKTTKIWQNNKIPESILKQYKNVYLNFLSVKYFWHTFNQNFSREEFINICLLN